MEQLRHSNFFLTNQNNLSIVNKVQKMRAILIFNMKTVGNKDFFKNL